MSDQVQQSAAVTTAVCSVWSDPAGRLAHELHAAGHDGESSAASHFSLRHQGTD